MGIFTTNGHLSLGQRAGQPDVLEVHAQLREELGSFVALLTAVSGQPHEIQETTEGDYGFVVLAQRAVVAQAVAQAVLGIDYGKFLHSFHVDFGSSSGFLMWVNQTGLQVAAVRS
jgi:hypothetical protein